MTDEIVMLDASNGDELFRRQVHANHLAKDGTGAVLRTAFTPRWKGNEADGRMSHLRGSVDPRDAWQRHVARGLESAGTWTTSVAFALSQRLPCGDDSALPDRPADHCFVEFERCDNWRTIADSLAADASSRGPAFSPGDAG